VLIHMDCYSLPIFFDIHLLHHWPISNIYLNVNLMTLASTGE